MSRITKDEYYLEIAKLITKRGTCIRRNYGAVIVQNDRIVSTGYTGSPRGSKNCIDSGACPRNESGCKQGNGYDVCRGVHAEQNAIINASSNDMIGSTMYVACDVVIGPIRPCKLCRSMIINAGIRKVVCSGAHGDPIVVYENSTWYNIGGGILIDFMDRGDYGY
jgi:dCMP deaminase